MSRYKLIKEYPGSPKKGTIYGEHMFEPEKDKFNVEDYSEFWSHEDNWVSEFTNSPMGSTHWLNTILARILHFGEALAEKDHTAFTNTWLAESRYAYGEVIMKECREIIDYFEKNKKLID